MGRKRKLAMPLFIIAIMVLSGVGFAMFSQIGGENTFGEYRFFVSEDLWTTMVDEKQVQFHFLPNEVLDIPLEFEANHAESFLTSDPAADPQELSAASLGKFQMQKNLVVLGHPTKTGFLDEYKGQSVFTCDDATAYIAVVVLKIDNSTPTEVTNVDNCITVSGSDGRELLRAKDRLLFSMMGIN